jgi:hypothetical protein
MNRKLSFLIVLLMSAFGSFSQEHMLGAILMDKAAYEALPHPPLLKASGSGQAASGAGSCPGIVMLNNPPVGDQGSQGSCVGWGVGYTALSILVFPQYGSWSTTSERSPSYIYNQIKIGGCNDGSYIVDGLNLVVGQGSSSLSLMPYNQFSCSTMPNSTQTTDAAQNKAGSWSAIWPTTDVDQIKAAICAGYPVVIGFTVTAGFDNMWADDGIWDDNSGTARGGHCTCIIGYDDTKQMFKSQNQWGTSGGDNGFFWIPYTSVQAGYLNEAYRIHPGCASNITITGSYGTPLKESNTWIRSSGQTTISSGSSVKLDADPQAGYVEFSPSANSDFFLSAPNSNGVFIAQALDGCGFNIPVRYNIPGLNTAGSDNFTLSPNPAQNAVTISADHLTNASIVVYDLNGRQQDVHVQIKSDNEAYVTWSALSTGIYMLKIGNGETIKVFKLSVTGQ